VGALSCCPGSRCSATNGSARSGRAFAAGRELLTPPPDKPGPLSLSDPDHVRELLTSAGFADVRLRGLNEPMYFGRDVDDACQFISGQFAWMMDALDADTRARALDGYGPTWPITRPIEACCTTRRPGSSRRGAATLAWRLRATSKSQCDSHRNASASRRTRPPTPTRK
jgi:hypothetical protein